MRDIAIFDIDGVLADCEHRIHHILEGPKDWDAFDAGTLKDPPILPMIDVLVALYDQGMHIVLLTGRSTHNRKLTKEWLNMHGVPYDTLIMRKEDDHRPAHVIKLEYLKEHRIHADDTVIYFEDDPEVVKAFLAANYNAVRIGDREYIEALSEGGHERSN